MPSTSDASLLGKIASYTEILAKDPTSTVFVPLAEIYRRMGLLDDALEVVNKGIRAQPRHAPGYTALGRIQAQRNGWEEAAGAFEKALQLDEVDLAALRGLTRLHLRTGKKENARHLLKRILELRPEDQSARELLGRLGSPAPVPAEAEPRPTEPSSVPTTRKAKGDPISTPTIAEIYIRQGFPKRAMKVYRDLLKSDPHNAAVRQKLVQLKEQMAREAAVAGDTPPAAEQPAEGMRTDSPAPVETAGKPAPEPKAETPEIPDQTERTLNTLDLWLQSIHRRREDVR